MSNISFSNTYMLVLMAGLLLTLHAHCYIGVIYHLYNQKTRQHLFLLGDCHKGRECGNQQKHILQAAQLLGATIIAEDVLMPFPSDDMYSQANFIVDSIGTHYEHVLNDLLQDPHSFNPNKNYYDQDHIIIRGSETPLKGIVRACHYKKIPVINVECRFVPTASKFGLPISGHTVCRFLEQSIEEISTYHDNDQFNDFYQCCTTSFRQWFSAPFFKTLYDQEKTLWQSSHDTAHTFKTEMIDALANFTATERISLLTGLTL